MVLRFRAELLVLAILAAAIFLFHYLIMGITGYPSGEDGAGQLAAANCLLHGITCGEFTPFYEPPLYFVVALVPSVTIFGIINGIIFVSTVMQSLLMFPSYLLARKIGASQRSSIVAALLVGTNVTLAGTSSWNSGLTLFALVFYVFFLAFLVDVLKGPTNRNMVLTAFFFALAVGSHELFAVLCPVTVLVALYGFFLYRKDSGREEFMKLPVLSVAFSLPFAPFYINRLSVLTNIGYNSSVFLSIQSYLTTIFTWGNLDNITTLVELAGILVGGYLLLRSKNNPAKVVVFGSILVGATTGLAFDTADWYRMVIIIVPASACLIAITLDKLGTKRFSKATIPVLLVILMLGYTIYSMSMFVGDVNYFSFFCSARDPCTTGVQDSYLAVLDHMKTVPKGVVYSTSMVAWLEGYSQFEAVGPYDLYGRVTQTSYNQTFASDMIYEGNYDVGNGYLNFALNAPQNDTLAATWNGDWYPVINFNSTADGTPQSGSIPVSVVSGGKGEADLIAHFQNFIENIIITNSSLKFSWTSESFTTLKAAHGLVFFGDNSVVAHPEYAIGTSAYQFTIAGDLIYKNNMTLVASGPFTIYYQNSHPESYKPYFYSSAALLKQMNVRYMVLSSKFDQRLFFTAENQLGFYPMFHSDNVYVLSKVFYINSGLA